MSRGRNQLIRVRVDARLVVFGLVAIAMLLTLGPARSHSPSVTVDWGDPRYFGEGAASIVVTEGEHVHFTIGAGGGDNHTVRIPELDVSSPKLDEGDSFETGAFTVPGSYTVYCQAHRASQGHETVLMVKAATTTTTTPTTTTTSTTTTTTTTVPGGSTTTSPPGGTTTTTTRSPGGSTTTSAPGVSTTIAGTTTTATVGGSTTPSPGDGGEGSSGGTGASQPGIPGGDGDGDQALGVSSPRIDDAGWVRPLWWGVLTASIGGLVWVAIAWRRRPTEYD